jgi:hypothetical protein
MKRIEKSVLLRLLALTLRPAIRFCLRHSLHLNDLIECTKAEFVDAAALELTKKGDRPNTSRISVMTGVHRRDIERFKTSGLNIKEDRDLVTRVIGQWRNDKRFLTKSGEPKVLSAGVEGSEFHKLCRVVSRDINPGTVFYELTRVGAIVHAKGGIKLVHKSYVPEGDPIAGFSILADDSDTLCRTVEENILAPSKTPQLHARTTYDNIRPSALAEIKKWLLDEGHELHSRVRKFVSQFDQDINPDPAFKGKGTAVVFTTFGNVEEENEEEK